MNQTGPNNWIYFENRQYAPKPFAWFDKDCRRPYHSTCVKHPKIAPNFHEQASEFPMTLWLSAQNLHVVSTFVQKQKGLTLVLGAVPLKVDQQWMVFRYDVRQVKHHRLRELKTLIIICQSSIKYFFNEDPPCLFPKYVKGVPFYPKSRSPHALVFSLKILVRWKFNRPPPIFSEEDNISFRSLATSHSN